MGRASGRKSCSGKRCVPGRERKNEQTFTDNKRGNEANNQTDIGNDCRKIDAQAHRNEEETEQHSPKWRDIGFGIVLERGLAKDHSCEKGTKGRR